MICAYHADFRQFQKDCAEGSIATKVAEGFDAHYGYSATESERTSWNASLPVIAKLLGVAELEGGDVFLELQMPLSSARCDLLLVGKGEGGQPAALVVELKQWSRVSASVRSIGRSAPCQVASMRCRNDDAPCCTSGTILGNAPVHPRSNRSALGSRVGTSRF
jgi:hypothetical protein